ncbi:MULTISPECIES: MBL fold metallo-hydrolase [unclassified Undibacterium]|uniref:MBL fold metallo-hydrolase n=1 Tax=unclassified Undibacterium TaxID=2630295 RepID=UPI002AC9E621|nr:MULTISPECIES: MBL fold metallo-hydrolase [unclassified Undibacterium]MEB0138914.1 MBL fold metallo-hydrolase [Undibacterium sp. CCC2.1]MEB0171755.1 MBL fold metallo-hydrolase [Undibacterium sp. CCC1.1]MEB0175545.1 MBL fold metallo-hydrolase [Undibacterium sp. CCC3.4]MEB0214957.1 MBL fold metallo-hydrolase [Undibacterium sp. 5I2]WPX45608.1 MBL fold metallo-hydrolase [Undibacterium sp. CCC3.4]
MQVWERGWLSSNNILFLSEHSCALVDSAYLSHAPQTLALLEHALQGRQLDLLVNTHLHSDHCGGNAIVQQRYGCRTLIPAAELAAVQNWDQAALSFTATGQQCARFCADAGIAAGDQLLLGDMLWDVLAAPGHDAHALIFYQAQQRLLISADALWENGFGVIFPELEGQSGFAEQAAILEVIRTLDVRLVIPGHGPVFTDVTAALARAEQRLAYLEADPKRNALNALKVMLAFLLLERRRLDFPLILNFLHQCRSMQAALHLLGLSPDMALPLLVAQLLRAGVAVADGQCLVSSV